MLTHFFEANRSLCEKFERWLFPGQLEFSAQYNQLCVELIRSHPGALVLDIGAGNRLLYGDSIRGLDCRIIGCDVAVEEIVRNDSIHYAVVGDASTGLPLKDGSVDLITSHYCIEHLPDVAVFVKECARVLKPTGRFCVLFGARNSLHAVLNRVVPHVIARRLLYFFYPQSRTTGGFKAYYDRGTYSQFTSLLHRNSLGVQRSWHQFGSRGYFVFFFPAYVAMLVVDFLWGLARNKDWAAHFLFIAVKEPDSSQVRSDPVSILRHGP